MVKGTQTGAVVVLIRSRGHAEHIIELPRHSKLTSPTVRSSTGSFRDHAEMQRLEVSTIQLPHLLRYEDRNSMRHATETRLPFLDYRIVEFGCGLPVWAKLNDGWSKYVLRASMADVLPPEIAWRRDKLGFEAPMRSWLAAAGPQMYEAVRASALLREVTDHACLLDRYLSLPWPERWRYCNVATWERVFEVTW